MTPRAKLLDLRIVELSGVDRPCHQPATVALMKRAPERPGASLADLAAKAEREQFAELSRAHEAVLVEKTDLLRENAALKSEKSTRAPVIEQCRDMTKTIVLTEAQHAHYSKLSATDGDAFLAKSSSERDTLLAEIAKSDPVVFKGELTGFEVRKSQGDFALKLAQSAESSEKSARSALAAAEVEKSAREATELRKRATETMPNLAGSDDVHCAILKAVESIADEPTRTAAVTALKAANDAAKSREVAKGINPGSDPQADGPQAEMDALVAKHVAEHKCDERTARLAVVKSTAGRDLYTQIELLKKQRAHA